MKKNIILLGLAIITTMCYACNSINLNTNLEKITGDKNIVTQNVSISEYQDIEIELFGENNNNISVFYGSDSTKNYFSITVDSNILEMIDIGVENQILIIKMKKEYKNYSLDATEFCIHTNSSTLRNIKNSGSSNIIINKSLEINNLKVEQVGSGNLAFKKTLKVDTLEIEMAGSSEIHFLNPIFGKGLSYKAAGSGSLSLSGKIENADINISGSGNVSAKQLTLHNLKCDIAGSGNVIVGDVDNTMTVSISGSGNVSYSGNPKKSVSISGSGNVSCSEKAEESAILEKDE